MAYTVDKTNSSASPSSYTVQDGVLNTQTDLKFIGKGYAGYGEVIHENFLHLLENFANNSAPSKPIQGQLWYDSGASQLKVYTGSNFVPAGNTVPYGPTAPANLVTGDLWIDSDTAQLFFYNGTSNILIGPNTSAGANTNGFTFETITDNTDTDQNVTKLFNNGNLIAIISEDEFTPKAAISGFGTIKKGITLSTAISDLKFAGTSTDTDALGGVAAANYLRSNANDTTSGTISVANDGGLVVGADSDFAFTVDSSGGIISNNTSNTDITFKVNDAGVTTTVMTIDGSESRVGIGTTTPTTKLQVSGTTTSTAFAGALTGDVTGNIAGTGASSLGTLAMGGTLTSKNILPDTNTSYDIGSTTKQYNLVYAKSTSAQYADLAEIYVTDSTYAVGTVMIFGGANEVTQSTISHDTRVAGVISEDPAYLMNSGSEGQAVALVGKVKCKVHGMIKKGDLLTTCGTHPGHAQKAINPVLGSVIGKAMEDKTDPGESAILISVGRL